MSQRSAINDQRLASLKKLAACRLPLSAHRPGTSLIELILFLTIFSIVGMAVLPILFSSTENRMLQQTIAVVEQNGAFALQAISLHVHNAERVIAPLPGQSGSVLVLKASSGAINPTIIGINSGSLVIAERLTRQDVTSSQVGIQNFKVRNTSVSSSRQSIQVSFQMIRTIRLQSPHTYVKTFETSITLLPDDAPSNDGCACLAPSCAGNNTYSWQVCTSGICYSASTALDCP